MGLLGRAAAFLSDVVARTGAWAPVVLFFASFVEYVFPPFPGDTVVLLGAWYAVHGALSWPAAFVAVTTGAMAGAYLDWRVGRAIGRHVAGRVASRALDAERLARFEESYRRHGPWLLAANRFLPGVRAFIFVAAGAARIPLGEVLVYGGLSAAAWNVLLLFAGAFLAKNIADLSALLDRYTAVVCVLAAAVVAWIVVRALARRRARRAA